MKQFFRELFEYSHHFNQELGDIFAGNADGLPERSVKLYSHILNAHHIWNSRITLQQATFGVWTVHDITNCRTIDRSNHENTLLIIDKLDLDETISYTNSRGDRFTNSVRDILFHIVNHSTYHRGQIAMDLRQNGIAPLATDYIFYRR
ncbi:MAG: DUF664 domain-containing protein [Chitinophagaceae bacterium]|nr:DUF664 domain-containing protein [Chitinophagaceae bacterium]MCW5927844.1 DUF664 domain-containing protein [Chitinophagaceae bacterium]